MDINGRDAARMIHARNLFINSTVNHDSQIELKFFNTYKELYVGLELKTSIWVPR